MTQEEKVALLKEAGVWDVIGFPSCIDKLFDLVAAHEREKQAEQEPVAYVYEKHIDGFGTRKDVAFLKRVDVGTKLYAAPVRTKDLTDDELASACGWKLGDPMYEWIVDIGRWAIAADREKNK